MTDNLSDRDFAAAAMKRLAAPAEPGLERKLLAGYDRWNARRAERRAWPRRLAEAVWPGMPAWAPLSAFGFALLLGLGVGTALPSFAVEQQQPLFSLEQPAPFSLVSPDMSEEDL